MAFCPGPCTERCCGQHRRCQQGFGGCKQPALSPCWVLEPRADVCYTCLALGTPGAANGCPRSRQGCWVPFQEGWGISRHHCLSFPFGRVLLLCTSLPDPQRWLLWRAGTCHHAGRGPHWGHAWPLRCLTQAGPCLPFPCQPLQRQPGLLSPSVQTGDTGCTAPGADKPPTHSHPIPQLAPRIYVHATGQGDLVPGLTISAAPWFSPWDPQTLSWVLPK